MEHCRPQERGSSPRLRGMEEDFLEEELSTLRAEGLSGKEGNGPAFGQRDLHVQGLEVGCGRNARRGQITQGLKGCARESGLYSRVHWKQWRNCKQETVKVRFEHEIHSAGQIAGGAGQDQRGRGCAGPC